MKLQLKASHQVVIGSAAALLILLLLSQIAYRTAGSLGQGGDVASRAQNLLLYSDNLLVQLEAMDRELEASLAGGSGATPGYIRARTRIVENLELLEALSAQDLPNGSQTRHVLRLADSKLSGTDHRLSDPPGTDDEIAAVLEASRSLTAELASEITLMQRVELAALATQTVNESMRARNARNSILLVSVGAIVFLTLGSVLMIGDLRKNQKAGDRVRESENRLRALIAGAPVGIFLTDRDGRIELVNERYTAITGLGPRDLEGQPWTTGVHPEDLRTLTHEWQRASSLGHELEAEWRAIRPDGRVVWVRGRYAPLVDEGSSVTGFAGSVTDAAMGREGHGQARRAKPSPRPDAAPRSEGRRVLVVTADRDLAQAVAGMLADYSVSTVLTARGADALGKLSSDAYDGIVLHLRLPDMDGRELLDSIRRSERHRTTPVLAITPGDGRQAVAGLRVQGFAEEPVRMEALLDALRRAGLPPGATPRTERAVPAGELS